MPHLFFPLHLGLVVETYHWLQQEECSSLNLDELISVIAYRVSHVTKGGYFARFKRFLSLLKDSFVRETTGEVT